MYCRVKGALHTARVAGEVRGAEKCRVKGHTAGVAGQLVRSQV